MQKATPTGTPIYRSAPLNTHSPANSGLQDASLAIASATGTTGPVTWDSLRKEARQVESEIETKLTSLSKFAVRSNTSSQGAGVGSSNAGLDNGDELEVNIEALLEKLSTVVDAMSGLLDTPGQNVSSSVMHGLQRHRDILHDYTKEYRKTRQNVRAARDHAQLLSSVQGEIDSYKNGNMSASDYMLSERAKIDGSHLLADSALEQAYATKDDLDRQRTTLQSVNSRINNVANQLPGVGQLIGKIQSRKSRDNVILSCVIGSCVVGVLYFTVL
ncbi:hypothetical protein CPC16_009026 [Podila verticillata]|nr:hypothetical protein BGZ52_010730 [Haplosporangium bisporale]KAF9217484.1 hypothetical protein BGZ59_003812 [Podila verticillata]KAF9383207.1 hypothetical protein CPC16_009026 [Podila verticillata]KAI9236200.1 MAG: hypothetical protein BYD32DRAFT_437658 [Podila humilis]KFH70945.1 hypothetical protein MVEG_03791 [Podila verticillata NRRL 6337]